MKAPPAHPELPDVPATSEEVAAAGWATPNNANVSESWSSIAESTNFPAENPPAEPSQPAAPKEEEQEEADFAPPRQEKVDSETTAEPTVAAPAAANAWGTSAPAPASNNTWSDTPEPGKTATNILHLGVYRLTLVSHFVALRAVQQTCEEIEAIQFKGALKTSEYVLMTAYFTMDLKNIFRS